MDHPHAPGPPLAELRRSYARGGLAESDLADTWEQQFAAWFADASGGGILEPNAVVLATASTASGPSARTVLCKAVDSRGFVLYTNLLSRKASEALGDGHGGGRAGLCFPWVELERQVCVTGTVEVVADDEADAYFASRPRGSRLGAWASPQSEVVDSRAELVAARASYERAYDGGEVPRPPHWGGLRVVPETVEFWQGREDRLHDRLRYRRTPSGWLVERLAP